MTNSLKNTVDQSTDKFMPSDKYQVGTFASKEYVGGLNLNDASQFDKEQVQAELAENFEARETVSSGYVRLLFVIPVVTMMMKQIRPPRPAASSTVM